MANHASHGALPYPIKGARYTVLIPYLDADGDPTDPTTPDTEISEDDGSATDTAEEAASPKNSVAMLTLTGAETDCSVLSLAAKAASGPKTTLLTLSPMVLAIVGTGTLSAGSAGGGTLGTLLAYDVTGCFIKTTGGTGGGGTGGANNQARKIITYNTSSGAFTVAPNWETTPSTDTTYDVLLPDGVTLGMLKALNPATAGRTVVVDTAGLVDANTVKVGPTGSGTAQTARDVGASVLLSPGTGTGQISLSSGAVLLQATQAGVTIPTVTTLTNAPSDSSGVTTLLSRLSSARAGYLDNLSAGAVALQSTLLALADKILGYFQLSLRSDAAIASDRAAELAEINANEGSGAGDYDPEEESQENIFADAAQLRDFGIMQVTTIATLASQTGFTLTAGSPDNDAYNGASIMITDATTEEQKAFGFIDDYVGSTKGVTLKWDPGIFTMAVGDHVTIKMPAVTPGVKKGKALANFEFVMIDSSDDISGKTGLTVTAERSIDGGAFAACSNSVSEISAGAYKISLSATDLAGNIVTLKFTATGANATLITIVTEP